MSKLSKNKVILLFLSTSMIMALLFVNMNLPISASESSEPIYLHGPPLTPIHMHSNESLAPIHMNSNITLTPVHLHYVGPPEWDPIEWPLETPWHELYPEFCIDWLLTSWEDNGDKILSPNDQIDMVNLDTGNVTWYHVDRITWTLNVTNEFEKTMFIEFKGPPETEDPIHFPVCTLWHEVWPSYCNVYHIINWIDSNGNGVLDFCDFIEFDDGTTWHVEDVARDIILREKIMDPICTWWHEIHPNYCKWWHLTSWEDEGDPMGQLSPGDQINMIDEETQDKTWYYVDRVTLTLNVSREFYPAEWMKIELKTYYFEEMYNGLKHPIETRWHEVYPSYCNVYTLTRWDWFEDDNCNGVLDVCDYIWLLNETSGLEERYHVDDICYDLILNKKIMDPIGTEWHELYPSFCNYHNLTSWEEDPGDPYLGRLSPNDQIDMYNETSGETKWYHVNRVTLGIYITINVTGEPYYFEYKGPFEDMYLVKTKPISTLWTMVWPWYLGEGALQIEGWIDNCNGVLDHCDYILLSGMWCHVEEVAIDIILNEKITDPVFTWWHELYPDFCNWYHIIGWEDNGDGLLSPCDWIDLDPLGTGYHVENVTLTLNVTIVGEPGIYYYFEYKGPFEDMYLVKTDPICTDWMMVGGEHGMILHCENWTDNCNGVLDYCDLIQLGGTWCHIEEVAIDIIVKKPIHDVAVTYVASRYPWVYQGMVDPIGVTVVNEGDYTETVDVYAFYDSNLAAPKQTVVLNPGDTASLTFSWLTKDMPTGWYIISANATIPIDDDPPDNVRIGNEEQVRLSPPLYWKEAYPDYAPSGMPDFDQRQDAWENPPGSGMWSWCAPTAVANSLWWYDSKYEPNPIPPPTIIDNYPLVTSYAPGLWDDHDQRNTPQLIMHLAYLMDTDGQRTGLPHFGTAVWDMQAGIAQYLSWSTVNPLGDVNGDGTVNQTDVDIVNAAMGTSPGVVGWDMRADIEPVTLGWPAPGGADNDIDLNDLALVMANMGQSGTFYEQTVQAPEFPFVEEEIERSEDIILMLGFWYYDGAWWREEYPYPYESGHCVTAAGVNSTTMEIAISDPIQDNAEAGGLGRIYPPPPHPHPQAPPDTVHNDASYVSHDIYPVALLPPYFPSGIANFTLVDYASPQYPGGPMAVVEWAVTVSPLGVHDVAVTNTTVCCGATHLHRNVTAYIKVTVANEGDFTETFDVTVYWNSTHEIETKNVMLASGANTTIQFHWDTTSCQEYADYTISVYAHPVLGETDLADNTFTYGNVLMVHEGDVDGDRKVRVNDVLAVAMAFGSNCGEPEYDPNCDITCDNKIRVGDVLAAAMQFGWGPPPP